MEALVLNVDSLPFPIRNKFQSSTVIAHEQDGGIMLLPIQSNNLWGLLDDGKFTTEKFLEQKKRDKALEL